MSPSIEREILDRLDRIETLLKGDPPSFDPSVFSDPRGWDGPSYKDKKFSECPSQYLALLAKMYDTFSEKSAKENATLKSGQPKAPWDKKLADTARAWMKHAAPSPVSTDSDTSELPF